MFEKAYVELISGGSVYPLSQAELSNQLNTGWSEFEGRLDGTLVPSLGSPCEVRFKRGSNILSWKGEIISVEKKEQGKTWYYELRGHGDGRFLKRRIVDPPSGTITEEDYIDAVMFPLTGILAWTCKDLSNTIVVSGEEGRKNYVFDVLRNFCTGRTINFYEEGGTVHFFKGAENTYSTQLEYITVKERVEDLSKVYNSVDLFNFDQVVLDNTDYWTEEVSDVNYWRLVDSSESGTVGRSSIEGTNNYGIVVRSTKDSKEDVYIQCNLQNTLTSNTLTYLLFKYIPIQAPIGITLPNIFELKVYLLSSSLSPGSVPNNCLVHSLGRVNWSVFNPGVPSFFKGDNLIKAKLKIKEFQTIGTFNGTITHLVFHLNGLWENYGVEHLFFDWRRSKSNKPGLIIDNLHFKCLGRCSYANTQSISQYGLRVYLPENEFYTGTYSDGINKAKGIIDPIAFPETSIRKLELEGTAPIYLGSQYTIDGAGYLVEEVRQRWDGLDWKTELVLSSSEVKVPRRERVTRIRDLVSEVRSLRRDVNVLDSGVVDAFDLISSEIASKRTPANLNYLEGDIYSSNVHLKAQNIDDLVIERSSITEFNAGIIHSIDKIEHIGQMNVDTIGSVKTLNANVANIGTIGNVEDFYADYANITTIENVDTFNANYANITSTNIEEANITNIGYINYASITFANIEEANIDFSNIAIANIGETDINYANITSAFIDNIGWIDYARIDTATISYIGGVVELSAGEANIDNIYGVKSFNAVVANISTIQNVNWMSVTKAKINEISTVGQIYAGYVNIGTIGTVSFLKASSASIDSIGGVQNLSVINANINNLSGVNSLSVLNLSVNNLGSINQLNSGIANINTIQNVQTFNAVNANITNIKNIESLTARNVYVTNASISTISNVNLLSATNANISIISEVNKAYIIDSSISNISYAGNVYIIGATIVTGTISTVGIHNATVDIAYFGSCTINYVTINAGNIDNVIFKDSTIENCNFIGGTIQNIGLLTANKVDFTSCTIDNLKIDVQASGTTLNFQYATISNVNLKSVRIDTVSITNATITNLSVIGQISTLNISYCTIATGVITNSTITNLTVQANVKSANIYVTSAGTIGTLQVSNATILNNLEVSNVGHIHRVLIDSGTITGVTISSGTIGNFNLTSGVIKNVNITGLCTISAVTISAATIGSAVISSATGINVLSVTSGTIGTLKISSPLIGDAVITARNLSLTSRYNLISDGDMESPYMDDWYIQLGTASKITADKYSGSRCMEISGQVFSAVSYQIAPNTPLQVRGASKGTGYIFLYFYDANGAPVTSVSKYQNTTVWSPFTISTTVPSNGYFFRPAFITGTAYTLRVDDIQVIPMVDSNLIVDGAVIAKHIQSGQVQTKHLRFDSVTVDPTQLQTMWYRSDLDQLCFRGNATDKVGYIPRYPLGAQSPPPENLVLNQNFEDDRDGDGVPDFWEKVIFSGSPTFGRDSTTSMKGAYSAYIHLSSAGEGKFRSAFIPIVPGKTYYISCRYLGEKGRTHEYGVIHLEIFDRNKSYDWNKFTEVEPPDEWKPTLTQWVKKEWVYTVPESMKAKDGTTTIYPRYIRIVLRNYGSSTTYERIYYDDVVFSELRALGPTAGIVANAFKASVSWTTCPSYYWTELGSYTVPNEDTEFYLLQIRVLRADGGLLHGAMKVVIDGESYPSAFPDYCPTLYQFPAEGVWCSDSCYITIPRNVKGETIHIWFYNWGGTGSHYAMIRAWGHSPHYHR